MRSLVNHSLGLSLFTSALIYFTSAFPDSSGDKTMKLRIGFDLTQGENGAPFLRIRDFEDSSEFKPRAANDRPRESKTSPSVRADFFNSESSEVTNNVPPVHFDSSKERDRSDDDSTDDSDRLSTRGINPEEYEPEENARVHAKYQESSDSDSDLPRHREKRQIHLKGLLDNLKKKSREFFSSQRKQGISVVP